jgi:hypothetical protein
MLQSSDDHIEADVPKLIVQREVPTTALKPLKKKMGRPVIIDIIILINTKKLVFIAEKRKAKGIGSLYFR